MKNGINTVLGIDIGGTGIKSGIVNTDSGELESDPKIIATPQPATPEVVIPQLLQMIQSYHWNGRIGIGFPGVVKTGVIYSAANLDKSWFTVNLIEKLGNYNQSNICVINDADAAALAEMSFGAGVSYNQHEGGVVLIITLGTGIGSTLFVDGHLVPNTEFGHMEMDGRDAEKWAATVIREKEDLSWERWGERVNHFLQIMEMLLSPDLIIIGGGVSENPEKFFPFIELSTKHVPAKLSNNAGIVGAALSVL
jgi:polyphosphate glucokinase